MKVAIGMRLQSGPFGGGNRFGTALSAYLQERGWQVVHDLRDPDIDLILLTDPRSTIRSSAFQVPQILDYLSNRKADTLVIHRVNECDERRGGVGDMNARLLDANWIADHTIFVSAWLRDLFQTKGWPCPSVGVIRNGADAAIFNDHGQLPWDGQEPLRLVTHHWGAGWLKGFDLYQHIDQLLVTDTWRGRLEFTYVGNLPEGFRFHNARHVPPLNGAALATELRSHHVYVTGSQFEPGGNHQNEGAACGLPLLYRDHASMGEYCQGFGLSVEIDTLPERLEEIMACYPRLRARMPDYPHRAAIMVRQWEALFIDLMSRRESLLASRRWPALADWTSRQKATGVEGKV